MRSSHKPTVVGKVVKDYTFEAQWKLQFDVDVILRTLSDGVEMLTRTRSALVVEDRLAESSMSVTTLPRAAKITIRTSR